MHHLERAIDLDATADSGLVLRGHPGEDAVVSGGLPLDRLQWRVHHDAGRAPSEASPVGYDVPPLTVWAADTSVYEGGLADVPGLRLAGARVVRARHPNGDPETMGLHTNPSGWNSAAEAWLPGRAAAGPATPPVEVIVRTPNRSEAYAVYPFYEMAIGGICNGLFTPNVSFWCNPRNPRDGAHGVWNGSGGLVYSTEVFNGTAAGPWTHSSGRAVAHVWHDGGHWATQMYHVDNHDPDTRTLKWSRGGFQDARASPNGAEWCEKAGWRLRTAGC